MNKPGFSLIEILMGFALVGMVFGIGGVSLFTTLTSTRKAAAITLAKAEGQFALRSITDKIKFASSVICAADNNRIQVNNPDGTSEVISLVITSDPDKISVSQGTLASHSSPVDLTTDKVSVSVSGCSVGVMFACLANKREVDVCFGIDSAEGIDVTDMADDTGGIMFRTGVTLKNLTN